MKRPNKVDSNIEPCWLPLTISSKELNCRSRCKVWGKASYTNNCWAYVNIFQTVKNGIRIFIYKKTL